jgi:hypothetical protein
MSAGRAIILPEEPLGPRLVWVRLPSCDGCPALRLKIWRDAAGVHTSADCDAAPSAIGLPRPIATYWRLDRHPPGWCPADQGGAP